MRAWLVVANTWLLLLIPVLISGPLYAHEVRPAYLALVESEQGVFDMLWKRPVKDGGVVDIKPGFPSHCQPQFRPLVELTGGAKIQRGVLHCVDPALYQGQISIEGIETTLVDVLLRIEWQDGDQLSQLLSREQSSLSLNKELPPPTANYLGLGFEHILEGVDHLLFVLALLFIVKGHWALVKTITSFTLAHSITLVLASFGCLTMPSTPVEAAIAVSIALVAAEAIYQRRGLQGYGSRWPWLMAFLFGLLHGLGFAGALAEVGLPPGDIPLALLLFNMGIELGQLVFVVMVLSLAWVGRLLVKRWPAKRGAAVLQRLSYIPIYLVGTIGMYWGIERSVSML